METRLADAENRAREEVRLAKEETEHIAAILAQERQVAATQDAVRKAGTRQIYTSHYVWRWLLL